MCLGLGCTMTMATLLPFHGNSCLRLTDQQHSQVRVSSEHVIWKLLGPSEFSTRRNGLTMGSSGPRIFICCFQGTSYYLRSRQNTGLVEVRSGDPQGMPVCECRSCQTKQLEVSIHQAMKSI